MIPTELGELEAFRSLLAGQEQAEIGGALCTSFAATPGSALFNRASDSAFVSRRLKPRSTRSTLSSLVAASRTASR